MKEAIKRLRSVGERGMRESAYREVDDSLALYRQDLELVLSVHNDIARYFDNLKVIDNYKHEHPNATNEELEISLEKEVALYRELFSKITKGVVK